MYNKMLNDNERAGNKHPHKNCCGIACHRCTTCLREYVLPAIKEGIPQASKLRHCLSKVCDHPSCAGEVSSALMLLLCEDSAIPEAASSGNSKTQELGD